MDFQAATPGPITSQPRLSQANLLDESKHSMNAYFKRSTFATDHTVIGRLTQEEYTFRPLFSPAHGFISGKSYVTHLLEFQETESGNPVDIIYLDLCKG